MMSKLCAGRRSVGAGLRRSLGEMKRVRVRVSLAMLLALNVVLSYFGSFYVTQELKVSTSFLALSAAGYLFGPVPAALIGALTDVIQYFLRPMGPFFPGYMLSGFLNGLIYGFCLYGREGKGLMIGIPVSKLLVNLFVNIGLNTLWLRLLYGTPYLVLLPARALKNGLLYPVEVALLYVLTIFLSKNRDRLMRGA